MIHRPSSTTSASRATPLTFQATAMACVPIRHSCPKRIKHKNQWFLPKLQILQKEVASLNIIFLWKTILKKFLIRLGIILKPSADRKQLRINLLLAVIKNKRCHMELSWDSQGSLWKALISNFINRRWRLMDQNHLMFKSLRCCHLKLRVKQVLGFNQKKQAPWSRLQPFPRWLRVARSPPNTRNKVPQVARPL